MGDEGKFLMGLNPQNWILYQFRYFYCLTVRHGEAESPESYTKGLNANE